MNRISVKVISPSIEMLGEIDLYNSLFISSNYDSTGEFQIITTASDSNLKLLQKNNFIMVDNNNEKIGLIKHRQIDINDEGREVLVVKGQTLDGILHSRIVYINNSERESIFNGNDTTLISKLMNENFITPSNPNRRIHNMLLDVDDVVGTPIDWKLEASSTVGDTISDICKVSEIGYKFYIHFATKKIIFKLYKGTDKTRDVVFSLDLDNIRNMSYIDSDVDKKNVVYIKTLLVNADVIVEYSDDATGIDRLETFIDVGGLKEGESLTQFGDITLDRNSEIDSIEGEMLSTHLFEYNRDFELGDIVTVQNKDWGITKQLRITNVTEIYEDRPKTLITFGKELPTLAKKIKNYVIDYNNKQ